MSYQDTLLGWHDFYLAGAGASATFAGLLFVGLSLHIRIVVTHPEARSLVAQGLADGAKRAGDRGVQVLIRQALAILN